MRGHGSVSLSPGFTPLQEAAFRRTLHEAGIPQSDINAEVERVRHGRQSAVAVIVDRSPDARETHLFCGEARPAYGRAAIMNDADEDGTPHWKYRIRPSDSWSIDYPTRAEAHNAMVEEMARDDTDRALSRGVREARPTYGEPAPRSRRALHNRETTYEVVADLPDGRTVRLGFTNRPSRARFIGFAREHRDLVLPFLGDDDTLEYSQGKGLRLGPVVIRRSGRTERDCAAEVREDRPQYTANPENARQECEGCGERWRPLHRVRFRREEHGPTLDALWCLDCIGLAHLAEKGHGSAGAIGLEPVHGLEVSTGDD